jgi:poly(3-hydroxyalkanoate) synthetase
VPPELARLRWDDYLSKGARHDRRREGDREPTINALGFCVGGTMLRARSPCSRRAATAASKPRF